ncbi:MAG TPA: hypothetical protein VK446_02125 [Methylocystis sp.]|nr:hypothetical protein [Methylocystis sp.]
MHVLALLKLLFASLAMVGLLRVVVLVFVGDMQKDPAIGRLIDVVKPKPGQNLE